MKLFKTLFRCPMFQILPKDVFNMIKTKTILSDAWDVVAKFIESRESLKELTEIVFQLNKPLHAFKPERTELRRLSDVKKTNNVKEASSEEFEQSISKKWVEIGENDKEPFRSRGKNALETHSKISKSEKSENDFNKK